MADLIDRAALFTDINDREAFIVIGAGDNICIDIADINKAPTIEAKPVVHGKWKRKKHKLFGNTYESYVLVAVAIMRLQSTTTAPTVARRWRNKHDYTNH